MTPTWSPGQLVGAYQIVAVVGEGGMGLVYKARDTRLDRWIALKVIKGEFDDRYRREAKAISALNHPNICALYDVGDFEGLHYLIMEFIEGESLRHRLLRGPLGPNEVLRLAREIASALTAAHRKGVTHRDLKPSNIMLTTSGAKLVDFGLARTDRQGTDTDATVTMSEERTPVGHIFGTLPYMAPEQLEGKLTDYRTDLFAFGAVMYEASTGRPAFIGKSPAALVAAILKSDPGLTTDQRSRLPRNFGRLIRLCLAKNPEDRWQSARDLLHELEWLSADSDADAAPQEVTAPCRFAIAPPEQGSFTPSAASVAAPQLALAPDGRHVAFVASGAFGQSQIWIRSLEHVNAKPITGTDGAQYPFWAPDSQTVGFFAEGKLKRVGRSGGPPQTICGAAIYTRGGTWGANDIILFSNPQDVVYQVSAKGGRPEPITTLDSSHGEAAHWWPQFLPDGSHFLFSVRGTQMEHCGIYIGSLDRLVKKRLLSSPWSGVFASPGDGSPGYVLFTQGANLLAYHFDSDRLQLVGEPISIAEGVGTTSPGYIAVSASTNRVLAYASGFEYVSRLVWYDRTGQRIATVEPPGDYLDFRISRKGTRIAVSLLDPKMILPRIWVQEPARATALRLSSDSAFSASPVWSPQDDSVAYRSWKGMVVEFVEKASNGAGHEKQVASEEVLRVAPEHGSNAVPTDWSADGKYLVYHVVTEASGFDLWLLPLTAGRKPVPLLRTRHNEMQGALSPDGNWLAYSSDESGRYEIYVQAFAASAARWLVSNNGGVEPRWRSDGREIYYLDGGRNLMAVPIRIGDSFHCGIPRVLFGTNISGVVGPYRRHYDVMRGGRRFLISTLTKDPTPTPLITVLLNWGSVLKSK